MRAPGNATIITLLTSGSLATLLVTGIGAYVKLDEKVSERPTTAEVRQAITDTRQSIDDLNTTRYQELIRRLDRIDRQLDKMALLMPSPTRWAKPSR